MIWDIIQNFRDRLRNFEDWFNQKFGWFFTNGMKATEDMQENC